MTKLCEWKKAGAVLVVCAATAILSSAQTLTTLLEFDGSNGGSPMYVSLTQGHDGRIYGTTVEGGADNSDCGQGCGTVFAITPKAALTTLHSFNLIDGALPWGGVILATDGNFYGTTFIGEDQNGEQNTGTVFKMTPKGNLTTLHAFHESDGTNPDSGLSQTSDSNLYGVTYSGGSNFDGTVFKITPGGTLTTLYNFGGPDGSTPQAPPIQASDGNLYGTTLTGGAYSGGTIYKITPEGNLTTFYNFCAQPNCADGAGPYGLVQGRDGAFYGAASASTQLSNRWGTIFKITLRGVLTILHTFNGDDGSDVEGTLIQGTDGNLYGKSAYGGSVICMCGTIFMITPDGLFTPLYSFSGVNGNFPLGGLLQATNGIFYGTTTHGADDGPCFYGCGTLFSLDMGLGPFVAFVRPAGKIGQTGGILGQGFTGTTDVSINGIPGSFTVVSDTYIRATVPAGATTGYVTVTTPSGALTSNVPFQVIR
jgi:uncharacterized repeat protein (TIGR03803 family)